MKTFRNLPIFLLLPLLLSSLTSHAQHEKKISYKIDPVIKKELAKKNIKGSMASLDTHFFIDGKETDIPFLTGPGIPRYTLSTRQKDSIMVSLIPMLTPGNGMLNMRFYGDTVKAWILNSPKDEEKRFKHKLSDKAYQHGVEVAPASCTIIIAEKPLAGKPIEGYIDFESEDYFMKEDGKDQKCSYRIKGYFIVSLNAD